MPTSPQPGQFHGLAPECQHIFPNQHTHSHSHTHSHLHTLNVYEQMNELKKKKVI